MHKLSRRHVIATLSASSVLLCPALLNAQVTHDWGGDVPENVPLGQDQLLMLGAGPASVEVTALAPGQVAVLGRPTTDPEYSGTDMIQYVAVMRRTDAQVAFGAPNDRTGTVQDPRYYVANLVCPHRGKALGITGNPDAPFACTDQGRRHGSIFDATGFGIAGASDTEYMSIPSYAMEITESGGAVSKAVINLA